MSKKEEIIRGTTSTGFEYEIPSENIENYELLEALGEMEDNPLLISKVINLLLGNEEKEKLKNHVRTKSGIVSTEKIGKEIKDIFENVNKIKNS